MSENEKKVDVFGLFPIPLFKFQLNRAFTNNELDYIKNTIIYQFTEGVDLKNTIEIEGMKGGVGQSKNTFILEDEPLKDLRNFIQECLNIYFIETIKPAGNVGIQITQSWVNFLSKGHSHHSHFHSNSLASGVIYIDAPDDSVAFTRSFTHLDHRDSVSLEFEKTECTPFNSPEYIQKVQTGDLLIFPSNIMHQVKPVKDDRTRISLAFNSFPFGELGNAVKYSYLKIPLSQ